MPLQKRMALMEDLKTIDAIFDEHSSANPGEDVLAAYWEAQMERGEDPDLDLTIEDLKKMGKL